MKVISGIGVPGCGKTTYLKPFAQAKGMVYISPDEIREELTGDASDHTREMDVWRIAHERLKEALASKDVVIDATYSKKRDRRELIERSREAGAAEVIGYWFDTPLATCVERNQGRSRIVPEAVLAAMYRRLQLNPPTTEEGFDRIVKITP